MPRSSRAIALSIEDANRKQNRGNQPSSALPSTHDEAILISSDEDETPLPPKSKSNQSQANINIDSNTSSSAAVPSAPAPTNSFLSERAQLEAARLERLKNRQAQASNSSNTMKPVPKRTRQPSHPFVNSDEDREQHVKKSKLFASVISNGHVSTAASSASKYVRPSTSVSVTDPANGLFWDGQLRQTANMHVDKNKDIRPVFRLHDIIGDKSELAFVILSSYVTQLSWIYSLLPSAVPVVLVGQPDDSGNSSVHNVLPNWVKVTPFLRGGRGCMHIKLMLLFYKSGRLRVVIPTANLVDYDWRDIENSVWLQDIPARKEAVPRNVGEDDFPTQLERVLHSLNVPHGLRAIRVDHPNIPISAVTELRSKWDFSKVEAQLLPSLAGKHEGWPSVLRVGHIRLMRIVRQIGARADPVGSKGGKGKATQAGERTVELECQGSSIGTYSPSWIDEFYCSARGESPETRLDEAKAKRIKRLDTIIAREGWKFWKNIKILFPTLKTVHDSRLGPAGAGTMFCRRRQWSAPKFPRPLFHDSNSKRGPVLMHTKMILATLSTPSTSYKASTKVIANKSKAVSPDPDSSVTELSSDAESEIQVIDPERDSSITGWLYVGSHNFTPSAWGTLSGSSFTPVLNITNYELGVVLPIKDPKQADELTSWIRPPRSYQPGKDEPWIQGEED
ncbi:tyrosyl-DNA phosphodiesterase-domain-containing protein [Hysterangium stoloniferum]|nr:tyrosyl-DNA phosphodiesterase-domain-containing protein [Hysterangium stoloniferum]